MGRVAAADSAMPIRRRQLGVGTIRRRRIGVGTFLRIVSNGDIKIINELTTETIYLLL